jgi:hypothetical protein
VDARRKIRWFDRRITIDAGRERRWGLRDVAVVSVVVPPVLPVVAQQCPSVGNGEAGQEEEHHGYGHRAAPRWKCMPVDRARRWPHRAPLAISGKMLEEKRGPAHTRTYVERYMYTDTQRTTTCKNVRDSVDTHRERLSPDVVACAGMGISLDVAGEGCVL